MMFYVVVILWVVCAIDLFGLYGKNG